MVPKVIDIPEGTKPKVPETRPGVPLLIDSPEYPTTLKGDAVDVTIPVSLDRRHRRCSPTTA